MLAVALLLCADLAIGESTAANGVICDFVPVPRLHGDGRHDVRMCAPGGGGTSPLHLFAHGAAESLAYVPTYYAVQERIASSGFATLLYESCEYDATCDQGRGSFLDALETISFFVSPASRQKAFSRHIDFDRPYTASGHSTGGRVVLMLAALRDTPTYLMSTPYAARITEAHRSILQRLSAVVAVHPDGPINGTMDGFGTPPDPRYGDPWGPTYPDAAHFAVTKMPVLILTGSLDNLEPPHSAWSVFVSLWTANKTFLELADEDHMAITRCDGAAMYGPVIAHFAQAYGLGDEAAASLLFGNGPSSFGALPVANGSDSNQGNNLTGFVSCQQGRPAVPLVFAHYCEASHIVVYV